MVVREYIFPSEFCETSGLPYAVAPALRLIVGPKDRFLSDGAMENPGLPLVPPRATLCLSSLILILHSDTYPVSIPGTKYQAYFMNSQSMVSFTRKPGPSQYGSSTPYRNMIISTISISLGSAECDVTLETCAIPKKYVHPLL